MGWGTRLLGGLGLGATAVRLRCYCSDMSSGGFWVLEELVVDKGLVCLVLG
jgi:hypothetical protein